MRTPRRRSKSTKATPTEPTHSRTLSETVVRTETTESLGATVIKADQTHPIAVQQRRDALALQKAEEGARRGARFSGGHPRKRGVLWHVLAEIVVSPEFQDASWLPIMREAAKKLDYGRIAELRLYYQDSSGNDRDIGWKAFQVLLSKVRSARKNP